MSEIAPGSASERLYPLLEQAGELDDLAVTGEFVSNTFEGTIIHDTELETARGILSEACHSDLGVAAERRLREADAVGVWHHSNEVALLTVIALQRMGASERAQRIAARAALAHDVGKEDQKVREAIDIPGELDGQRRRTMESHSQISAVFAREHGATDEEITAILMHHVFVKFNEEKYKRPYPENVTMVGDGLGETASQVLATDPEIMLIVATLAYADSISACATGGNLRSYHALAANFKAALDKTVDGELDIPNKQLGTPVVQAISSLAQAA